jgi:hypothetical protein
MLVRVLVRSIAVGVWVAGRATAAETGAGVAGADANAGDAFSTISIELSALGDVNDDTFQSFWDPGFGAELAALAPVPHGFLELAAHPFGNEPLEPDLPEVRMLATWLGWGADLRLPRRVVMRASLRTGVVWMLYDATATNPEQDENELAFGARATVHVPLTGSWSAQAGARAAHVLTHEPLDMIFLGGGLAYTFATPDWLRRFLE